MKTTSTKTNVLYRRNREEAGMSVALNIRRKRGVEIKRICEPCAFPRSIMPNLKKDRVVVALVLIITPAKVSTGETREVRPVNL